MRALWVFLLALLPSWAGAATDDPATAARAAAQQLEQASVQLGEASGARDRVRALTRTVQAYEAGLAAMRDGLRQAAVRELQIRRRLQARESEIARLLAVLQTIGRAPGASLLLHPAGPTGTARSGMIVADVTPALADRASALRAELEEVTTLRTLQEDAAATLQQGLTGVQTARTALSQAIADRVDLPRRFTEDPVKTAILIASTETLEGFASGLSQIAEGEVGGSLPDITGRRGDLPMPVQGRIIRRSGESDAAGVTRPGIVVATRPRALVTAPTAATIRYRGPLLDYGTVVILEPQADLLFVFAGLDTAFGEPGQVIPQGSPVGLMGGSAPDVNAILSQTGDGTGSDRTETLYIDVRQGTDPVDPETWFRTNKE